MQKQFYPAMRHPTMAKHLIFACVFAFGISGCSQSDSGSQQTHQTSAPTNSAHTAPSKDSLVGCYTDSHSEPAQIKIIKNGDNYAMQMREFNDPKKGWDKPEAMQLLASDSPEIQKYFDIKADEHKYLEKVIARPDRVFVLAKITDSFASLNPQYDSPYLGFIYKGSNTVYQVACEQTTQL